MRSFVVALLAMAAAVSARKKVVLQSGLSAESNAERWHAVRSSEGAWTAVRDSDLADKAASAAWAELDNKVTEEGWAYLRVTTNPTFSDTEQAYAAGYIEGNVTAGMIAQMAVNAGINTTYPTALVNWLEQNRAFVAANVQQYANTDPFWHQVGLVNLQLDGLLAAYHAAAASGSVPDYSDLALATLTISGDLEDLEPVVGGGSRKVRDATFGENGHCSMLVKLLQDRSDVYLSQVTWSGFEGMLRIYKLYDFAFRLTNSSAPDAFVPMQQMSFSSYPGSIFSGDDYYTLSSGLASGGAGPIALGETTIGCPNATRAAEYILPNTVLEWARNLVANRLAYNASAWAVTFGRFNSGTYNNDFLVLDFSKFRPGAWPVDGDGLLVRLQQLPGMVQWADVSGSLSTDGYVPSFNVPSFPEIFEAGGWPQLVQQYGEWFSYDATARANIFRRDQGAIASLADMQGVMRYCDFQHDPLSTLGQTNLTTGKPLYPPYSAENCVAARDDLNIAPCPSGATNTSACGTYIISALGQRDHAAVDAKITAFSLSRGSGANGAHPVTTLAQSGPTYDQQPAFRFSASPYASLPHQGVPDLVQWPWVTINFQ